MRTTTISILALLEEDPYLIKNNIVLPDGVDADVVEAWIIRKCMPFELVYPDTALMAYHIRMWALGRSASWTKMYETVTAEYNPLHNYDMTDNWTNMGSGSGSNSNSGSSGMDISKSAYDGIGNTMPLRLVERDAGTSSGTGQYSNQDRLEHRQHRAGNIGVMSTQELIQRERDIADFSIYDQIAAEFVHEFCLAIY